MLSMLNLFAEELFRTVNLCNILPPRRFFSYMNRKPSFSIHGMSENSEFSMPGTWKSKPRIEELKDVLEKTSTWIVQEVICKF